MRLLTVLLMLLGLSGCGFGGSNDFMVVVERPLALVYQEFESLSHYESEVRRLGFAGEPFKVTHPAKNELLITVPSGADRPPSLFTLRFTPINDGKMTQIHVTTAVPTLHVAVPGKNAVIDEDKVEAAFSREMNVMALAIEKDAPREEASAKLVFLLDTLGVIADPVLLSRYEKASIAGSLADLFGDSSEPFNESEDRIDYAAQQGLPQSDPDEDARKQDPDTDAMRQDPDRDAAENSFSSDDYY